MNGKTEPGDLSRGWWEPVYIYECTMMVFGCDRNPAVIDDLDGDGIPNNASNIRGDRLDTDFDGDSPWGDVADPDLDNDGIPNAYERPGINEASGLDHELTVNLNTRGIILGVLTYLLILILFFLPMFTGRVTIETTEGLSGVARTFGGYLMLLSVISIIPFVPTSGRGFLIVGLGVLAARDRDDRANSIGTIQSLRLGAGHPLHAHHSDVCGPDRAHDPPWPDLDPPQQRLGGRTEHR